mgnify:FL=1|jgi:hypothetical protein
MDEIEKDFKVEDIPGLLKTGEPSIWREIAENFPEGKEIVLLLSKRFSREKLYVPNYDTLMRSVRNRHYLKQE